MPVKTESNLPGMDAPASMDTELCFNPPNGPFDDQNVVQGVISHKFDEDWIAIELSEGKEYTITVTGKDEGDTAGLPDSVIKLLDGKGGVIMMKDDQKNPDGSVNPHASLKITPEAGSGTQKYYISVSAYNANPGTNNKGAYQLSVKEVAVLPVGESGDIEGDEGVNKLVGTDLAETILGFEGDDTIDGGGGDDTLNGGAGNDLLTGGKGSDKLIGGDGDDKKANMPNGVDTISYRGSSEGVTINLRDGTAMGGDAEGDEIGSDIENVIGSMYDDVLTGTDVIAADAPAFDNTLWGLGGMDRLYGGEGRDHLSGGAGDDMLNGGDEDDTLNGGSGADSLTGGAGKDTASYAGSAMGVTVRLHSMQSMGGDAEGDSFDGEMETVAYTVKDEDGEEQEMTETVLDIWHLTGSAHDDILAGDIRDNVISGGGGNDRLYGGPKGSHDDTDNHDTMYGGAGDDHIFGGKGNDTLHGDSGNDNLWGNGGSNSYYGGAGSDWIHANPGDATINGWVKDEDPEELGDQSAMEMMKDPRSIDTVSFAHLKEDALEDSNGDARGVAVDLGDSGGFGWYSGEAPSFPQDTISNIENIIGTSEDDHLTGGTGPNTIEGGEGRDTLSGGSTDNTGDSNDTVSYRSSDRGVRVDLGDGGTEQTATRGHAGNDTISNFENAIGSAHDDDLTGRASAASKLWGLDGDDTLEGKGGNDTLEGGTGADELDGGYTFIENAGGTVDGTENDEDNTLSYATSDAAVTVNLTTASASGGHAEGDEIETYEFHDANGNGVPGETGETGDGEEIDVATFTNVTGSAHNDHLTGDRFANKLVGNDGDDTLRGREGADHLEGGKGADMLDGGEDPKKENNNASEDWAVYRNAGGGVTVNLATGRGTAGEAMGDTLKDIELVWGSKDYSDTFIAGPGPDIIHGDNNAKDSGGDTVSYEASKHGVAVNLAIHNNDAGYDGGGTEDAPMMPSAWVRDDRPAGVGANDDDGDQFYAASQQDIYNKKGYAYGDVLGGIENLIGSSKDDELVGDGGSNTLKGGAGDDRLFGDAGADGAHTPDAGEMDRLYGEAGNDKIYAGGGNDMLWGGDGNDMLEGNDGNDTLYGGSGDDDLTGGAGSDTYVFSPGNGSDRVISFTATTDGDEDTNGTGDKIDLSAFGIRDGDLAGLLGNRGDDVIVNLEGYGGGRITIQDTTKEQLMSDDEGDHLIHKDMNDGDDGVGAGTDGIFIL